MKMLVFKQNFEGMSVTRNGDMETHIIDPSLLGTDMVKALEDIDLVIIDKNLGHNKKLEALKYGRKITGYRDGQLQRVMVI